MLAQSGNGMFQSNNSSINRSRVFRIETQRKQAGMAGNFAAGQVGNKEGRRRRSLAYLSVEADKSRMQRRISSSDSFSFPLPFCLFRLLRSQERKVQHDSDRSPRTAIRNATTINRFPECCPLIISTAFAAASSESWRVSLSGL